MLTGCWGAQLVNDQVQQEHLKAALRKQVAMRTKHADLLKASICPCNPLLAEWLWLTPPFPLLRRRCQLRPCAVRREPVQMARELRRASMKPCWRLPTRS